MNFTVFIIIPIVAGYIFSSIWNGSKFHAAREDGHRLYFRAAFYGLFCLISGFFLSIIVEPFITPILTPTSAFIEHYFVYKLTPMHIHMGVIMLCILFIGCGLGFLLNTIGFIGTMLTRFTGWGFFQKIFLGRNYLLRKATEGNELERLIAYSTQYAIPIAFELSSGKVYVGFATNAPDPTSPSHGKEISVLPLVSGYRETEEPYSYTFSHSYSKIYDLLEKVDEMEEKHELDYVDPEDFIKVINVDSLSNVGLLNFATYSYFQKQVRNKELDPFATQWQYSPHGTDIVYPDTQTVSADYVELPLSPDFTFGISELDDSNEQSQ